MRHYLGTYYMYTAAMKPHVCTGISSSSPRDVCSTRCNVQASVVTSTRAESSPPLPPYLQRRGDVHEGLKPTTKTATGLKPHEGGILASIPAPPTLGVKLTLAVAVRPSTVEAVTVSV